MSQFFAVHPETPQVGSGLPHRLGLRTGLPVGQ